MRKQGRSKRNTYGNLEILAGFKIYFPPRSNFKVSLKLKQKNCKVSFKGALRDIPDFQSLKDL